MPRLPVLMIGLPIVLAACNTLLAGKYAWGDGWRPGIVRDVQAGNGTFPIGTADCRAGVSSSIGPPAHRAAFVQFDFSPSRAHFNSNPKQRYLIVPINDAQNFHIDDRVYVNIKDCTQPLVHQ